MFKSKTRTTIATLAATLAATFAVAPAVHAEDMSEAQMAEIVKRMQAAAVATETASVEATARPQTLAFKLTRLFVSTSTTESFPVNDIKIGNRSQ